MANLTTTADIKAAVLKHSGELTDGTSPFDATVLEYINRVYGEIICGGSTFVPDLAEPWPWARATSPGLLTLVPAYETGTVALTNESTSGTFSSAPAASLGSFAGRFLKITGIADVYRISAHSAGSASITLDLAWKETTAAAASFSAMKLDYALTSGIARLVEPFRVFQNQTGEGDNEGKIDSLSPTELGRTYPLHLIQGGVPTTFAIVGETNAGVSTVRFNKNVQANARVEYEYVPYPSDLTASPDTTPLIPREHRSVLVFGATYWLMTDKSDSRADAYFRLTQQKIQGMLLDRRREYDDSGKNFAKLIPRPDQSGTPILRTSSGMRIF